MYVVFVVPCQFQVSEGLDFADINGRAVVITGLPFPPKMDPKVTIIKIIIIILFTTCGA